MLTARLILLLVAMAVAMPTQAADEVNLYSARKEQRIKPLLDKFTQKSGIRVNLLTAKSSSLIKRVEREGRNTPADVLLTVDVGRLHLAKALELTQPVQSAALEAAIPASYRDSTGHWFGLSRRVRPIIYSKSRVKPDALSTYEDLAGPQWKGRICLRSSTNIYNQSLVASLIIANGDDGARQWAADVVSNLAKPPSGGAINQVAAIAAGECDVTLINSYYLALMLTSREKDQRKAAKRVRVFWPNQNDRGAHVNVSGAAVTRHAKNKDNAIALLEYLASEEAQAWYASANFEYPVREMDFKNKVLSRWGDFKADSVSLQRLGNLNPQALKIMQQARWK